MRVRLNGPGVLKSYNPETMYGLAVVKVIDEAELIVEIDAHVTDAVARPKPEEHWKLIGSIRPKYLAGATVEIIGPAANSRSYDYNVKLVQATHTIPRNATFATTFNVRRSHLLRRA